MKNNIGILSLIKYNLIKCYNKNLIICSFIVTLITCRIYISRVSEYYGITGNQVNQWDYFFRIFSSPFMLEWLFVPILFFITAPISAFNDKSKYIYVRASKKKKIVIAQQLTNLTIITVYILLFATLIFLLGGYYSTFKLTWSKAIGEAKIDVATKYLFFNNFIEYYSPILATMISLLKFIGVSYLIILLRDLVLYITKNNIVSILISFLYLLANYINPTCFGYLSIGELGTIWCHKYESNRYLSLHNLDGVKYSTLRTSNIILISIIVLLLTISIFVYRRREVEKI